MGGHLIKEEELMLLFTQNKFDGKSNVLYLVRHID